MNRHYSASEFLEKIELIKSKIKNVGITTDVIVGFCGESEDEFLETLKVCEEINFDQIYISEYSQRKGTIAAKFYKDDISPQTKRERKEKLELVLKKGVLKKNKTYIGKEIEVLIYRQKEDGSFVGKISQGKDVLILGVKQEIEIGNFYKVKIVDAREFHLIGEITEQQL
jgi:tRNA-2-methylthio-N6-dimethylallyladenosine synthase